MEALEEIWESLECSVVEMVEKYAKMIAMKGLWILVGSPQNFGW